MSTRRKLPRNEDKGSPPKPSGKQLITLVAVLVAAAVIIAAVYVYSSDSGHAGYIPGDGEPIAPTFSLVDTEGVTVNLAQYSGSVVVVDFMGTTCEPCKTQIDILKVVHASYAARGVKVVSIDTNPSDANSYLHNYKLSQGATWAFAVDKAGASVEYSIVSIPTIVIIDQTGHIVTRNVGVMSASEISSYLDSLLGG